MKTWKLVSGILSIILFVVVTFQSCAVGFVNTLEENEEVSGSAGIIVAIILDSRKHDDEVSSRLAATS